MPEGFVDRPAKPEPNDALDKELAAWIEAINDVLCDAGVPLQSRPLQVLLRLLSENIVQIRIGEAAVDIEKAFDHAGEPWFQSLYQAVERWYGRSFGSEAIRGKGIPPLEGAVLIRGIPFSIRVPAVRTVVHVEGKEAWLYFEEGVGDGENPVRWIQNGPDMALLDAERRSIAEGDAREVASALRFIYFKRMGVGTDESAAGLADAAREYLQSASRRLLTAKAKDLGPAWFDLQMASESALKLVLQMSTGDYPHTHDLKKLLAQAASHGVVFDTVRLATWPDFATMSDYRYAQGNPGTVGEVFDAYRTVLDLVVAAMQTISTPLQSGAGFLLGRPPWLTKDADR